MSERSATSLIERYTSHSLYYFTQCTHQLLTQQYVKHQLLAEDKGPEVCSCVYWDQVCVWFITHTVNCFFHSYKKPSWINYWIIKLITLKLGAEEIFYSFFLLNNTKQLSSLYCQWQRYNQQLFDKVHSKGPQEG